MDPDRFDVKKMEENVLDMFAYLLDIKNDQKIKEQLGIEKLHSHR